MSEAGLTADRGTNGTFQIVIRSAGRVGLDEIVLFPDDHRGAGDSRRSRGVPPQPRRTLRDPVGAENPSGQVKRRVRTRGEVRRGDRDGGR
jgi:hypothetical protein